MARFLECKKSIIEVKSHRAPGFFAVKLGLCWILKLPVETF
jgi:hypothetical protein